MNGPAIRHIHTGLHGVDGLLCGQLYSLLLGLKNGGAKLRSEFLAFVPQ